MTHCVSHVPRYIFRPKVTDIDKYLSERCVILKFRKLILFSCDKIWAERLLTWRNMYY
jgi:hypothetical protein